MIAIYARQSVERPDSISIATAAKQKDDPENGIASIIVVCVSTSIVFASASTVCCTQIAHIESSNNDVYST